LTATVPLTFTVSVPNRHITVGLDGIVEMSEEDAACLIPAGWMKLADGAATT
jgi:hypothetical protein